MPWWAWLLAGVLVILVLLLNARAAFRRSVRQELLRLIREQHPGIELVAERAAALELRIDGATGTLNLDNLYAQVAAGPSDLESQRETIGAFLAAVLSQQAEARAPLSLERHGDRLLPRLAPEAFLGEASGDEPLLHAPSGVPGLVTLYVLDSEQSVMYLSQERLQELGVDLAGLHQRALANLRLRFPAELVRAVVEQGELVMVKAGDSFDATRLLLVPEQLREGEQLAAVIPDRETLGLLPVPPDGDWSRVARLARTPASPYRLLDRALRVTRAGFELSP